MSSHRGLLGDVVFRLDDWREECTRSHRSIEGRYTYLNRIYDADEDVPMLCHIDDAVRLYMSNREPDLVITRHGVPYLERWYIQRRKERCVYLHRFVGPDPDVGPHDHPWGSASLLVDGYQHESWLARGSEDYVRHRELGPGSVLYRPAEFAHQLRIHGSEPPLTIFVTGPMVRQWGFWVERDGERRLERRPVELREETT